MFLCPRGNPQDFLIRVGTNCVPTLHFPPSFRHVLAGIQGGQSLGSDTDKLGNDKNEGHANNDNAARLVK